MIARRSVMASERRHDHVAMRVRAPRGEYAHVALERFNRLDGDCGVAPSWPRSPTAIKGGVGRRWFSATSSVAWVSPDGIVRDLVTPPFAMAALIADDEPLRPSVAIALPSGARPLRIDCTTPSLHVPKRIRFRYCLHGMDGSWQQADDRRMAICTNPSPGAYRVKVDATKDNGIRRAAPTIHCSVNSRGWPRRLGAVAKDDIHCIAPEALANAVHPAHASRIDIDLEYGRSVLSLRIHDDDVGITEAVLAAAGRPGHWDLPGMRERAARLRARLQLSRLPSGSTGLELVVPARVAYARPGWRINADVGNDAS